MLTVFIGIVLDSWTVTVLCRKIQKTCQAILIDWVL
jgi:hypothetical protein